MKLIHARLISATTTVADPEQERFESSAGNIDPFEIAHFIFRWTYRNLFQIGIAFITVTFDSRSTLHII